MIIIRAPNIEISPEPVNGVKQCWWRYLVNGDEFHLSFCLEYFDKSSPTYLSTSIINIRHQYRSGLIAYRSLAPTSIKAVEFSCNGIIYLRISKCGSSNSLYSKDVIPILEKIFRTFLVLSVPVLVLKNGLSKAIRLNLWKWPKQIVERGNEK